MREKQKGQPLTIRESLEPAANRKQPASQCRRRREAGNTAAETAGIKLPYPLTAPAKPLTPGEESAKQTFMEMHLAAARAEQARRASRQRTRNHRPDPNT